MLPSSSNSYFLRISIHEWLKKGLDVNCKSLFQVILFATTLCRIWTARCKLVLQPDEDVTMESLLANIVGTTREIYAAMSKPFLNARRDICIAWKPPLPEIVKLNTDVADRANPGVAVAGGVIINSAGSWLLVFAAHLFLYSNVAAELHALRLGLRLAWQEGYRAIDCEFDAKVILDLIHSDDVEFHPLGALLMDIREMLSWEWQCKCIHTLR